MHQAMQHSLRALQEAIRTEDLSAFAGALECLGKQGVEASLPGLLECLSCSSSAKMLPFFATLYRQLSPSEQQNRALQGSFVRALLAYMRTMTGLYTQKAKSQGASVDLTPMFQGLSFALKGSAELREQVSLYAYQAEQKVERQALCYHDATQLPVRAFVQRVIRPSFEGPQALSEAQRTRLLERLKEVPGLSTEQAQAFHVFEMAEKLKAYRSRRSQGFAFTGKRSQKLGAVEAFLMDVEGSVYIHNPKSIKARIQDILPEKYAYLAEEGELGKILSLQQHHEAIDAKLSDASTQAHQLPEKQALKVLTLNAASLPNFLWRLVPKLNDLRPPHQRAQKLAEKILSDFADHDVICLQEVFDKKVEKLLIQALKKQFPYALHSIGRRRKASLSSGLLLLSRYPIVDYDYQRYQNLLGEDALTGKGFAAAKIAMGNRFVSVYTTHTQAGSGLGKLKKFFTNPHHWLNRLLKKLGIKRHPRTTSQRRDEELGHVDEHMQSWASRPVWGSEHLKHAETVLTGDLNISLNTWEKRAGISHGKSGRVNAGEVKYPQQKALFERLAYATPENFMQTRIGSPIRVLKNAEGKLQRVFQGREGKYYKSIQFPAEEGKIRCVYFALSAQEVKQTFILKKGNYPDLQAAYEQLVQYEDSYNAKVRTYQGSCSREGYRPCYDGGGHRMRTSSKVVDVIATARQQASATLVDNFGDLSDHLGISASVVIGH